MSNKVYIEQKIIVYEVKLIRLQLSCFINWTSALQSYYVTIQISFHFQQLFDFQKNKQNTYFETMHTSSYRVLNVYDLIITYYSFYNRLGRRVNRN